MVRKRIKQVIAKSRKQWTWRNFLAGEGGNKRATRHNADALLGTGNRVYTRSREVWMCAGCAKNYLDPKTGGGLTLNKILLGIVLLIIGLPMLIGFLSGMFKALLE